MTSGSKKSTALVVSVTVVGAVGIWLLFTERVTHTVSAQFREPLKEAHTDLKAKNYSDAVTKLKAAENVSGKTPVSAQFRQPLKEAHADLKAKNYSDAITKLKAAENVSGKTPADQYIINEMLSFAYIKTKNYPEAAKVMEAKLDSGLTPQSEQPTLLRQLAIIHYQIKNYGKAIGYGQRAIKGGHDDEEMQTVVGQAYYLEGDWKGTREFEDDLVAATIKQGKTPRKATLQLLYSACSKLPDHECAVRTLEQLRHYYPGTEPMAPEVPVGTVLAYFFGPPLDVEGPKSLPTSAAPDASK